MRAREFLSEGILSKVGDFFRKIYGRIVSAVSNAINSLGFGEETSFKIPRVIKEEINPKGLTSTKLTR